MEKYIHFTSFNIPKIESIFKYGILPPFNLMLKGIKKFHFLDTNNGLFFTSLTKDTDCNFGAYKFFSENPSYIGIEAIVPKVYKADKKYEIFTNTPIPIRSSSYKDEWQTNKAILPSDFTAIYFPLDIALKNRIDSDEILKRLDELKKLIELYNIDIPIIDQKVYRK